MSGRATLNKLMFLQKWRTWRGKEVLCVRVIRTIPRQIVLSSMGAVPDRHCFLFVLFPQLYLYCFPNCICTVSYLYCFLSEQRVLITFCSTHRKVSLGRLPAQLNETSKSTIARVSSSSSSSSSGLEKKVGMDWTDWLTVQLCQVSHIFYTVS